MSNKLVYIITIGEVNMDGIMADEYDEALIIVGRLIERLNADSYYNGKYIYLTEYIKCNTNFIKQDNKFCKSYLIEK
jgi:hypothetical protein